MPLRAKINQSMLPLSRNYSASSPQSDEVLFKPIGAVREVTLNRPKTLNAINENMVRLMLPRLKEYLKSETASLVYIKGAGGKALSAGGDVKHLALTAKEHGLDAGGREGASYFRTEFSLNHLIALYPKPYVSRMDSIVMGGGVGVSAHGSHRIGSDKTRIAMPETKIGYYPDVGGLWFLSRLDGHFGEYMALTSESIFGWTAYLEGITSHYIPAEKIADVERRLAELTSADPTSDTYFKQVASAIEDFAEEPTDAKLQFSIEDRQLIDTAFKHDDIDLVLRDLDNAGTPFAQKTAATIRERAPTSIKVALAAVKKFRTLDIRSAFDIETRLADHFSYNPDFSEGVLALLVEKREPNWDPKTLEDVTPARVASFFEPLDKTADLPPIDFQIDGTFSQYPHRFGLPSENDIKAFVTGETSNLDTKATKEDVLRHFERTHNKVGLKQRIDWVLARKTTNDKDFPEYLDWTY